MVFGWLFNQAKTLLKPVGEFLSNEILPPVRNIFVDVARDVIKDVVLPGGSRNSTEPIQTSIYKYGLESLKRRGTAAFQDMTEKYLPRKKYKMISNPELNEENQQIIDSFTPKEFEEEE